MLLTEVASKIILFSLATHYSLRFFTIFAVQLFLWMLKYFCFFTSFALWAFNIPYNLCIKTPRNPSPRIKIQCGYSLSFLHPCPTLCLTFLLVWVFLSLHLAFLAIPNSEIPSSHSLALKYSQNCYDKLNNLSAKPFEINQFISYLHQNCFTHTYFLSYIIAPVL